MKFIVLFLTLTLPLHASLKETFESFGYLWVKDFFSEEEVSLLQNLADQIYDKITQNPETDQLIIVKEANDSHQICRAEDLLSFSDELKTFIQTRIMNYLEELLEEPFVPFKDKINFKWPGGGAFLPHQDYPAFSLLPPKSHVNVMLSIDPANLENGCLYIAENWKKGNEVLPLIVGGPMHGQIQPEALESTKWIPLETSPRDLLLFTSFIPHYSKPNRSNQPRRAIFITFNRAQEGYHKDAYYHAKRHDPENPIFHIGTPTKARGK